GSVAASLLKGAADKDCSTPDTGPSGAWMPTKGIKHWERKEDWQMRHFPTGRFLVGSSRRRPYPRCTSTQKVTIIGTGMQCHTCEKAQVGRTKHFVANGVR